MSVPTCIDFGVRGMAAALCMTPEQFTTAYRNKEVDGPDTVRLREPRWSLEALRSAFPSPLSVKGRVLGSLLRGERLTHLTCWLRFGSARLSHHIYVLRGIGWPVEMIEQTVTTSDAGRPASIGVYFLTPETIAEAGDRGQQDTAECSRIDS